MKNNIANEESGFTIVELMIATVVLALILLLVTVVMINIGTIFDKGVNQTNVQDSVRDIVDQLGQNLQVSDTGYTGGTASMNMTGFPSAQAFCIGDQRFTYIVGYQLGAIGSKDPDGRPRIAHVLWRDNPSGAPNNCPAVNLNTAQPSPGGSELVPADSRLTFLSITQALSNGPYKVQVAEAYGDSDLLNGSTYPPPYNATSPHPPEGYGTTCLGTTGEQFCATAALTDLFTPRRPESL